MNSKVKELVEWVAHQLYDCKDKALRKEDWDNMAPVIKAFYIGQYHWLIERILSHPDLALIDRKHKVPEVELPKFRKCGIITDEDLLEYAKLTEIMARMAFIKAGAKFVIPLAEALKEVKDEVER